MTKTEENQKLAFARESLANQKFRAFAAKAKREGFPNIARLFRTSSVVERIHAQGNLNGLKSVGSTLENLKNTIAKEMNDNRSMYPKMLEQAVTDNDKAKHRFEYIIKSKEAQAQLYFLALAALKDGKDLTETDLYFCPFCGNLLSSKPEKNCSVCNASVEKFIKAD